jgi:tRNA pseudouridine55 synthase
MSLFGILNIDKPAGCTSRHVVDRVEQVVSPAKAGHAGTLDPLASGVLVICAGKATRLIQYVQQMRKEYSASFLLGHRSETDDAEGEVHALGDAPVPDRDLVDQVLPRFLGEIQQRPPVYSAVKSGGRRAYQLARQGGAPELAARAVMIHSISIERYAYPELKLGIECGSGTYIRALGRDVAGALGTAAVMTALRRTAIGQFRVEDAVAIKDLSRENLPRHLQSPLVAVAHLPRVLVTDADVIEIRHGRPIKMLPAKIPVAAATAPLGDKSTGEWAAVNSRGELVAILSQKHAGGLWPKHNFACASGGGGNL